MTSRHCRRDFENHAFITTVTIALPLTRALIRENKHLSEPKHGGDIQVEPVFRVYGS